MKLTVFANAKAFLDATGADLERNEEENNLLLGVAAEETSPMGDGTFFASVRCDSGALAAAAVMTPPRVLLLSRAVTASALFPLAETVRTTGRHIPGVFGPTETASAFAKLWASMTGRKDRLNVRMSLYVAHAVADPSTAKGFARPASVADTPIVSGWIAAFHREILKEEIAAKAGDIAQRRIAACEIVLWDDDGPRAMAASDRRTASGVAVNAVYTPPEWRGHGFATACVSRLTKQLLTEGRAFCVLFADLDNPVSNGIYRRIGYRPIAEFAEYRFEAGTSD